MDNFYDDGNWNWERQHEFKDSKTYFYEISFETIHIEFNIVCHYFPHDNILKIRKGDDSVLKFYVESFDDIKKILIPLVTGSKAKILPRYESLKLLRKEKLKKIESRTK